MRTSGACSFVLLAFYCFLQMYCYAMGGYRTQRSTLLAGALSDLWFCSSDAITVSIEESKGVTESRLGRRCLWSLVRNEHLLFYSICPTNECYGYHDDHRYCPCVCRNHILVDNEGAYFKIDDAGYCCNAFGYRGLFRPTKVVSIQ